MTFLKSLVLGSFWTATGVALALALGTGIGSACAIGTLFGMIAYLSYHFDEVRAAIPGAWHRAQRIANIRISISRNRLRYMGSTFLMVAAAGHSMACILSLTLGPIVPAHTPATPGWPLRIFLAQCFAGIAFGIAAMITVGFFTEATEESITRNLVAAKDTNIIGLSILIISLSILAIRFLGPFLWELICAIYSEPRIIFAGSVSGGVMAGWHQHSVAQGVVSFILIFALQYIVIHIPIKRYLQRKQNASA